MTQRAANSIRVIFPYLYNGTWVFDDDTVGLVREPFVSGIPQMINELVVDIPDAQKGFRLIFSATPFPGYSTKVTRRRGNTAATGTTRKSTRLKGGSAPRC